MGCFSAKWRNWANTWLLIKLMLVGNLRGVELSVDFGSKVVVTD